MVEFIYGWDNAMVYCHSSQPGTFLPLKEHLAMSGVIFNCQDDGDWGGGCKGM